MWRLLACAPPDPLSETSPSLQGVVTSLEGDPLAGAVLQACAQVCIVAEADERGAWEFVDLEEGPWSLHATGASPEDATLVLPVRVPLEEPLELRIPLLEPPVLVPETPTLLTVAPGLAMELSTEHLPGIAQVQAAFLEGELWPELPGLDARPRFGWSLSPTGAGHDLPFEIEDGAETWCTDADGLQWELCERTPELGSIVVLP